MTSTAHRTTARVIAATALALAAAWSTTPGASAATTAPQSGIGCLWYNNLCIYVFGTGDHVATVIGHPDAENQGGYIWDTSGRWGTYGTGTIVLTVNANVPDGDRFCYHDYDLNNDACLTIHR